MQFAPGDLLTQPDACTSNGPKKVLVVDDERSIADMLAVILNKNHYDAQAVYGGLDAVEKARHFCPDFVLSDVIMPGMNGVQAAIKIRELCPSCRILLFSGMATTADLLEEARAHGQVFELLSKPIHPRYLLEKLNS